MKDYISAKERIFYPNKKRVLDNILWSIVALIICVYTN